MARLSTIGKAGFAAVVVGAGFAWVGLRYGGPSTWVALVLWGSAAILGGAHSLVTGTYRAGQGHLTSEIAHRHTGIGAALLGATMLLPGLVMVVVGVAGTVGQADGLGAWASGRFDLVAMGAGTWALLGGVGLMVSRWTYEDQPTHWWHRLPGQAVGLLLLAIGVALLAAGRVLAADPSDPRAALGRIAEWIVRLLGGAGAG